MHVAIVMYARKGTQITPFDMILFANGSEIKIPTLFFFVLKEQIVQMTVLSKYHPILQRICCTSV